MRARTRRRPAHVRSGCCREGWWQRPVRYSATEWRCRAPRARAGTRGDLAMPSLALLRMSSYEIWRFLALAQGGVSGSKVDLRHRNNLGALMPGKVVKALLAQAKRKSQGIGNRRGLRICAMPPASFTRVREHEIRGHAVVGMKAAPRGPGACGRERPVVANLGIDPE